MTGEFALRIVDEPLQPTEQLTVDAGTKKGREKQEDRIAREKREAAAFWSNVFVDPVGRREMWKVFEMTDAFAVPFQSSPNGAPDPQASFFKAGTIAGGQRVYQKLIRICRDGLLLMADEYDPASDSPLKVKNK